MRKNRGIKATRKLAFVLFVFVTSLIGLGGRVYYLKTVHGEEYEIKAKTQQTSRYDKIIPPNKGSIVDRNKQILAASTTVYNIVLDSRVLSQVKPEEQEKTLKALTTAFPELDYNELKNYITINPQTNKPNLDSNWKYLMKKVDKSVKDALEAQKVIGIVYEKDSQRKYPLNTVACHVVGFSGQWGLEKQYQTEMSGTPGRSFISYDGSNRAEQQDIAPKDGSTIITTLDCTIQQYAEEVVEQAAAQFPCENTAALVMNPNTGEILAMADSRKFDLENPSQPLTLSQTQWDSMSDEDKSDYLNKTWRNFNTSDTFEPGSTFKPLLVAAALEENVITTQTPFYCPGYKQVADARIKCNLISGHGALDAKGVLAHSCNVGMMDIGQKMGRDLLYKYQKDFGFGSQTGVDLPGEASAASLMYDVDKIGPTELATMSFGQSFNATSLQTLTAFCAVINGGNLMKPYVMSQIIDKNGNIIEENRPEVMRKVISQETSDTVRNDLKAVMEGGTGKKARIEGYSIGGKTGTAQQGDRTKNLHTLSYICFLPVENPQVIVMCVINIPENYQDGVQTPAYMTKALLENIIKYMAIEPEYSSEDSSAAAASKAAGMINLRDFTGENLQGAVGVLDAAGLNYKIIGSGNTITNQAPHGGVDVEEGSEILLYVTKGEEDGQNDVSVPDVTGKNYSEAVTILNDMELEVEFEGDQNGVVLSQDPKAGIFVESGATVVKLQMGQEPKAEENAQN